MLYRWYILPRSKRQSSIELQKIVKILTALLVTVLAQVSLCVIANSGIWDFRA
jgi:hypothetical protein